MFTMANQQNSLTISNLSSATRLMQRTTAIFATNFFAFFLLSLVLFASRAFVANAVDKFTNDAYFVNKFSRLDHQLHNYTQLDEEEKKLLLRQVSPMLFYSLKFHVLGVHMFGMAVFTVVFSLISGVVFVVVVNDLLGRRHGGSFVRVVWNGSKTGIHRQPPYFAVKFGARMSQTYFSYNMFLSNWWDPKIHGVYPFARISAYMVLMPFSIVFPQLMELQGGNLPMFLFTLWALDGVASLLTALDVWVDFLDSTKSLPDILMEGYDLISTMWPTAILVKSFEHLFCESLIVRNAFTSSFGKAWAAFLQSAFEVYFVVAWLIVYFAARQKEANSNGGRRFGRNELENMINYMR